MKDRLEAIAAKRYPIDELRDCHLTQRRINEKRRIFIERRLSELKQLSDPESKIKEWEGEPAES